MVQGSTHPEGDGGVPGTDYCRGYLWFSHVEVYTGLEKMYHVT